MKKNSRNRAIVQTGNTREMSLSEICGNVAIIYVFTSYELWIEFVCTMHDNNHGRGEKKNNNVQMDVVVWCVCVESAEKLKSECGEWVKIEMMIVIVFFFFFSLLNVDVEVLACIPSLIAARAIEQRQMRRSQTMSRWNSGEGFNCGLPCVCMNVGPSIHESIYRATICLRVAFIAEVGFFGFDLVAMQDEIRSASYTHTHITHTRDVRCILSSDLTVDAVAKITAHSVAFLCQRTFPYILYGKIRGYNVFGNAMRRGLYWRFEVSGFSHFWSVWHRHKVSAHSDDPLSRYSTNQHECGCGRELRQQQSAVNFYFSQSRLLPFRFVDPGTTHSKWSRTRNYLLLLLFDVCVGSHSSRWVAQVVFAYLLVHHRLQSSRLFWLFLQYYHRQLPVACTAPALAFHFRGKSSALVDCASTHLSSKSANLLFSIVEKQ